MAEQPRDPSQSKTDADKKQPETVLLTAEELRAISGGAGVPKSQPSPNVIVNKPETGKIG